MQQKNTNYQKDQQKIVHLLLTILILASYSTASVLAAPESEGAIVSTTQTNPRDLTLPRVATSPAMATAVATTLIAQGGHRVTFLPNNGAWQAEVDENLPPGFSRKLHLPVIEKGMRWQQLANCSEVIQRQRIAVDFTPGSGYVYVGSRGLRGGSQQTLLHMAAAQGELAQVRTILKRGKIDINQVDEEGKSALHWAVIMDQKEIAALLLRHEADVALKDHQDKTALDYANADDTTYFTTIAALVQLLATLDKLMIASLQAGGRQNQAEVDQKLSEVYSQLEELEAAETQDQKQYRHFKYSYHALQASYLRALGDDKKAICQEKLAKKYKEPDNTGLEADNTGLETILLDAEEVKELAAKIAASPKEAGTTDNA